MRARVTRTPCPNLAKAFSRVMPSVSSHSSLLIDTVASKYMENSRASTFFGSCGDAPVASNRYGWTVGTCIILVKGLHRSR